MYFTFSPEMLRTKHAIRGEMDRQAIYGSWMFVCYVRKVNEIEEMIRPVGRPKKRRKIEPYLFFTSKPRVTPLFSDVNLIISPSLQILLDFCG